MKIYTWCFMSVSFPRFRYSIESNSFVFTRIYKGLEAQVDWLSRRNNNNKSIRVPPTHGCITLKLNTFIFLYLCPFLSSIQCGSSYGIFSCCGWTLSGHNVQAGMTWSQANKPAPTMPWKIGHPCWAGDAILTPAVFLNAFYLALTFTPGMDRILLPPL